MATSPKQSYHPYLLIAFYLNCPPVEWKQRIPKSTQHDWKHKDTTLLLGHDWFLQNKHLFTTLEHLANNKKLLQINIALLRAIALTRFMQRHVACRLQKKPDVQRVIVANIQKMARIQGLENALKHLQRSYAWYYQIRRKICTQSPITHCYISHPAQLLKTEIATIKKYCIDQRFIHWPLSSVYHQLIRDHAARFSLPTFYKYVAQLRIARIKAKSRRKNHTRGIRANSPLHIIHADTTLFTTIDHCRHYIYLVQDNYSKAILQYRVAGKRAASIMFEALTSVYEQFLAPAIKSNCQLITDGGVENFGPITKWANTTQQPAIQHLIAQQDIVFSNSMIEAANKQLKYRFLYHHQIQDGNALTEYVKLAIEDYNNRPNNTIGGLTPLEALQGKKADRKNLKQELAIARAERLSKIKQLKCCFYSF